MDQPHDVKITEATRDTAIAGLIRYAMGLLRSTAFTCLLIVYVIWTLAVATQILFQPDGDVPPLQGFLFGLAFLISLPGLGYLCLARDKGGNFMAPSVMVALIFTSYGLLAGYILFAGLAFMNWANWMVRDVSMWVGILSPILTVALSMLLAGIARIRVVWEPEPKRFKAAKYWFYLSPPLFFLICQTVYIVGCLVG
ncbi:hypothetical protein [Arthrobacter sp. BF1]|uniref:hypothetical protein n=1 Tax=Arthrobacter sp. BF1 TaxID=2821145 RepID=UPI001C4EF0DE|nr:hypothetical protein [Arthrobacter sp. BF1]